MTRISVIYNSVNHASLIAAALVVVGLSQTKQYQVRMVDIRDGIPEGCDCYLWIAAGNIDEIRKNHQGTGGILRKVDSHHFSFFSEVEAASTVIPMVCFKDMVPSDTVIVKAVKFFVAKGYLPETFLKQAHALGRLSIEFFSPTMEEKDLILYRKAIQWASYVAGGEITAFHEADYAEDRLPGTRNETLTQLVGMTDIGGESVQYVTTMSSSVHMLIRRGKLLGRRFIHSSMGLNGPVIWSDVALHQYGKASQPFISLGYWGVAMVSIDPASDDAPVEKKASASLSLGGMFRSFLEADKKYWLPTRST